MSITSQNHFNHLVPKTIGIEGPQNRELPSSSFKDKGNSPPIIKTTMTLKNHIQCLQPVQASKYAKNNVLIRKDLPTTTHVFVRRDTVRRPLEQHYYGPQKVLSRKYKLFTMDICCQKLTVAVDRLKPSYILRDTMQPEDVP
ncbi:hypothetical protein AVEN_154988-1 [Araneus ventricosus]|uniref:Uncharacterized protein n=1 Tax=Araneus ventricosus TaxID=182803 RepID=A0A4Y2A7Z0_ARAVE|nr:hypothetical protein AVEN_154988-1 [Araneus ventricosus]